MPTEKFPLKSIHVPLVFPFSLCYHADLKSQPQLSSLYMTDHILAEIEKSLERFMTQVKIDYRLHLVHPSLYESIREFSLRKGKRLRPLLLILSYQGYCPPDKKVPQSIYNASTCIEFLHNFMLIHDDIIDRSDLRRGKPTLHRLLAKTVKTQEPEKLGSDLAIIAGDIIYALAIDAFLNVQETPDRKERALKYFIQTAAFTAMGEFIDTVQGVEKLEKISEEQVFLNYTLKTARYTFDCPLVTGAILAGADNNNIKRLSELGNLIGQAFQIQDDIIGIFDSEKNIGKSILSDLVESKKTLLVCHTWHQLKGAQRKKFLSFFNKKTKTYKDLTAVRKIFQQAGSLDYCLQKINERIITTLRLLDELVMNPAQKKIISDVIFELFKHSERLAKEYQSKAKIVSFK